MIPGPCLAAVALAVAALLQVAPASPPSVLADRVMALTRQSQWTRVAAIPITFRTFHPQGLVKIGDRLFVSSVEVHDRAAGKGVGHLYQIDMRGNLISELKIGDGAMYHPGGLDYDGRHIWVAVAEYRPDSRSIVYRVDPGTMTAAEVFRFDDHLGALAINPDDRTLQGVSWGSRFFYRWTLDATGRVTNAGARPETLRIPNPSHYVDYQDCKYAGRRRMLCTGVSAMSGGGAAPLRLGGIDLVSLEDHRPVHQVPVPLSVNAVALTQNPVWLEPSGPGLRGYFMPEDDASTLYVYEIRTP